MKTRFALLAVLCTSLSACLTVEDTSINVPVPVVISTQSNAVHVCKISAFTETYQAENTSRGKAFLEAKKQCLANFDEMFCRDEEVKCTEYK